MLIVKVTESLIGPWRSRISATFVRHSGVTIDPGGSGFAVALTVT